MQIVRKRVEQIDTFAEFLESPGARILVLYGGAGSGKSFAVAQRVCELAATVPDLRIAVIRKTLPALRITAYRLVLDTLRAWGIPFALNKTEMVARVGTSEILFKSLDDPEKIKSAEFNLIWIEEATDLSREDFLQINLRLRRAGARPNQMILTFNPIDAYHWCIVDLVQANRGDVAVHHSTYRDNRYLDADYRNQLIDLANQDENYYRIYALGEPGILTNTIYSNYTVTAEMPKTKPKDLYYGLDFGHTNPSALVEVALVGEDHHVRERLYQTHLTNADLIARLKDLVEPGRIIYADAAEPARIEEIKRAGFTVIPADKSISDGIDFVKRVRLHVAADSPNLVSEIRSYTYRTDRNGRVLEEPVKFRDHLVDAMRYALYTHARRGSGAGRFAVVGGLRSW
jgi:phage terminase large subunit